MCNKFTWGLGFVFLWSFGACKFPTPIEKVIPKQPDTAAFEAVHFGMIEKNYNSTIKDTVVILGNNLFTLHPFFIPDDRRLYMLQIRSSEAPRAKFDTQLLQEMKELIEEMTDLYGNPGQWHGVPKSDKLEEGKVMWNCRWIYLNKEIKVGIGRLGDKENGFYGPPQRYVAVCEIVNKPLLKIANQQIVYTSLP